MVASFPGPCPACRRLQYGKAGEGLVHFLTWVTSRTGQIMRTWATCKPQKTSPTRMHWSTTIPSWKMAAHEGAFMSLFTRQSGGQRVFPSQDNEDTQQQFSRNRPRSINAFLPPFYPWCQSCEEMYQALSRFTVLQATASWVGGPGNEATMYGFFVHTMLMHCYVDTLYNVYPQQYPPNNEVHSVCALFRVMQWLHVSQ